MYYRVKLARVETGALWITPYYFTSKKKATTEATFWDEFFGHKYDGISMRIWTAKIIQSKRRMGGIKKIETKSVEKPMEKNSLIHSKRLKSVLRGKA